VLDGFLRSLQLHGAGIPETLDQRATLWRSHLAGRRALIVLDNAATDDQIRPVLPGAPKCTILITNQTRLTGLNEARLISLDVLPGGQAIQLLARIVGAERIRSQPAAAATIVRFCAGLPLAVRLAGVRLTARPHWPLQRLVELLADARRRLDGLAVGDRGVRASVALSYRSLGDRERRAFRLLGLIDAAAFAPAVAAALLDTSVAEAGEALDRLVDAQLLQVLPEHADHTRYRLNDLMRIFARECLGVE